MIWLSRRLLLPSTIDDWFISSPTLLNEYRTSELCMSKMRLQKQIVYYLLMDLLIVDLLDYGIGYLLC